MDPPVIRLQHSLLRNLLFPVYGGDQAAFIIIIFVAVYFGLYRFDPEFAFIGTVAAWGGVLGASLMAAPAVATITSAQHDNVLAGLKRRRFVHDIESDTWVAPLPRWLRWHHARVSSVDIGSGLTDLMGPRVVLRNLLPLSETRLLVTAWW